MANFIGDTSVLQYFYQLGELNLLHSLIGQVYIPPAVVGELAVGRRLGFQVPDPQNFDWILVRCPNRFQVLENISNLGDGETEVLALALELEDSIALLDDALARRVAKDFGIQFTGILGLFLDGKAQGKIEAIAPLLDQLDCLGFRVSQTTRQIVLKQAGESG